MATGRVALLLVISIGVAVAYGEEATPAAGVRTFHIPKQRLIDALQAYSEQAGVQVMFETASAAGLDSTPVEGKFNPEAALRTLLAETDLRIRYSRSSAVTLAPASAHDPDLPPEHPLAATDLALGTLRVTAASDSVDRNRLGEYVGAVQSDIQKVLKKRLSSRADYRFAVKLWVTPLRTIERAELDTSTGDHDSDSTILDTLRGLTLSQQAPPNTPQPIRFMISVHAL
ncbi:MAG: STN domain-containing protein [Bradyrhizobium sp.]|nr:STN domain-containing protein [Bradyrhizobium sp.]